MRDPWSGVAPIASATRVNIEKNRSASNSCGSGSLGTNDVSWLL